MDLALNPELDAFVRQRVASGEFADESEVVAAGLRLLRRRAERRRRLDALRRLVQVGVDQSDRGEVAPLDAAATLRRVRSRRDDHGPA